MVMKKTKYKPHYKDLHDNRYDMDMEYVKKMEKFEKMTDMEKRQYFENMMYVREIKKLENIRGYGSCYILLLAVLFTVVYLFWPAQLHTVIGIVMTSLILIILFYLSLLGEKKLERIHPERYPQRYHPQTPKHLGENYSVEDRIFDTIKDTFKDISIKHTRMNNASYIKGILVCAVLFVIMMMLPTTLEFLAVDIVLLLIILILTYILYISYE